MQKQLLMSAESPLAWIKSFSDLFTLDAIHLERLFQSFPCADKLVQGKPFNKELIIDSFLLSCHFLGTNNVLKPLNLPFEIIGEVSPDSASFLTTDIYPEPLKEYILYSVDQWFLGKRVNALNNLWNHDNLNVSGFASLDTRYRACNAFENKLSYFLRSLKSSVVQDLKQDDVTDSVNALVILPEEIREVIPQWPDNCYGMVILDDYNSWWNYKFIDNPLILSDLGFSVWPSLDGIDTFNIDPLEEIRLIKQWYQVGLSRPIPKKPINAGNIEDNIDW